jgi:hypothetical protein
MARVSSIALAALGLVSVLQVSLASSSNVYGHLEMSKPEEFGQDFHQNVRAGLLQLDVDGDTTPEVIKEQIKHLAQFGQYKDLFQTLLQLEEQKVSDPAKLVKLQQQQQQQWRKWAELLAAATTNDRPTAAAAAGRRRGRLAPASNRPIARHQPSLVDWLVALLDRNVVVLVVGGQLAPIVDFGRRGRPQDAPHSKAAHGRCGQQARLAR